MMPEIFATSVSFFAKRLATFCRSDSNVISSATELLLGMKEERKTSVVLDVFNLVWE